MHQRRVQVEVCGHDARAHDGYSHLQCWPWQPGNDQACTQHMRLMHHLHFMPPQHPYGMAG